jgi:DMSO/TMAO reductase YedYZ molybdopterin-dependent catalytic subunit
MILQMARPLSRRRLLAATAAGAVGSLAKPVEAGVFFWGRLFSVPPRETPCVTPNDQFYRVNDSDHSLELGSSIRVAEWSLVLHGAVERPRTLRYADVLEQRLLEQMVTLQCIDNEPGGV